jgi:catechol 2,3-dioxygenase-like lactoylglutathione lyase family enzyme
VIEGILETVVYCDAGEREATEAFYAGELGLKRVAGWETGTAFRAGPGVLLLFDRAALEGETSPVSGHGTTGTGHVCFRAAASEYDAMRERLAEGVTHDHEWPNGGRSFYFKDPAGNLLEVADSDLWPAA